MDTGTSKSIFLAGDIIISIMFRYLIIDNNAIWDCTLTNQDSSDSLATIRSSLVEIVKHICICLGVLTIFSSLGCAVNPVTARASYY